MDTHRRRDGQDSPTTYVWCPLPTPFCGKQHPIALQPHAILGPVPSPELGPDFPDLGRVISQADAAQPHRQVSVCSHCRADPSSGAKWAVETSHATNTYLSVWENLSTWIFWRKRAFTVLGLVLKMNKQLVVCFVRHPPTTQIQEQGEQMGRTPWLDMLSRGLAADTAWDPCRAHLGVRGTVPMALAQTGSASMLPALGKAHATVLGITDLIVHPPGP